MTDSRNAVLNFRNAVLSDDQTAEKILESCGDLDFLRAAEACGFSCSLEDVKSTVKSFADGSEDIVPFAGDATWPLGDATWPLRRLEAAHLLLKAALDAVSVADGTWPLSGPQSLKAAQVWTGGLSKETIKKQLNSINT